MKRQLAFVALALFALPALPVRAATWNYLVVPDDPGVFFFDAGSVARDGDQRTVLLQREPAPPSAAEGRATSITVRDRFDCAAGTIQAVEVVLYAADGSVVARDVRPKGAFYPAPDTAGADLLQIVCLPDFPAATHPDRYGLVPDGDVHGFARRQRETRPQEMPPAKAAQ